MNIIWNDEEIKKIEKIILQRTNFRLDQNNELKINPHLINRYSIYNNFTEELQTLINYQNNDEITKVLTNASLVEPDFSNPLHYGLVISLSKSNPEDRTYIFEIFKEIISQYERVISDVVESKLRSCKNYEEAEAIFNKFKTNIETTDEECLVKLTMQNIFYSTNGIERHELFKPICQKYSNMLKEKIQVCYNTSLSNMIRKENEKKSRDIRNHKTEFKMKMESYYNDNMHRGYSR